MQLEISKNVVHWLVDECFPMMEKFAVARINMHEGSNDVEFWTGIIVKYTLQNVIEKFERKYNKKPLHYKIDLQPAETFCFYRFLFNYPLLENQHWRIQQRQFLIDQLHKGIANYQPDYLHQTTPTP